jgi:hypothetical protein
MKNSQRSPRLSISGVPQTIDNTLLTETQRTELGLSVDMSR